MRKVLKKIHLVLSLPVGLIISFICFTGAILIFDKEIDMLFYPERFYVSDEYKAKEPLPLDELVSKINTQLDTNSVKSITIYADKERTYIADLKKGGRSAIIVHPHTAQILHKEVYEETFYFKVMSLHRWIMGKPSGIGREIVRISTIILVIISITGLILWIPRNRKHAKHSFTISLTKSFTRFLYDLHAVGGMYVFALLLLLSITGLAISYPTFKKKLENTFMESKTVSPDDNKQSDKGNSKRDNKRVAKETPNEFKRQEVAANSNIEIPPMSDSIVANAKSPKVGDSEMQKSLELLESEYDNFEYITIDPAKATIHLKNAANERAHEFVLLNKNTGEIKKKTPYAESNSSARFNGWVYSLHVGSYWGMFSKILTFIAAFIGGLLPLSGYYLYFKRRYNKKKAKK